MPALRGFTIAVGEWYARTLEICLIRNMRHFVECLIVTTPDDEAVKAVVAKVPGARVFETTAFFEQGARFNKGLAFERAADHFGRHGWWVIHDADVLFPDAIPLDQLQPDRLHGARRRVLEDVDKWHPGFDWNSCPVRRDGGPVGFAQILHADDPALAGKPCWYDVTFTHAGGGDAFLLTHWPASKKVVLNFDVLHLGPCDAHWFGTDQEGKDMMAAFVHRNGWRQAMLKADPTAVNRVGEIVDRVEVPGYPVSNFELPFVKRAKLLRQ